MINQKWNFEKKNTERFFWNIINIAVAFCYWFEVGYMDEADTLTKVAKWDSMSTLDLNVPSSKTTDAVGWALRPNLVIVSSEVEAPAPNFSKGTPLFG